LGDMERLIHLRVTVKAPVRSLRGRQLTAKAAQEKTGRIENGPWYGHAVNADAGRSLGSAARDRQHRDEIHDLEFDIDPNSRQIRLDELVGRKRHLPIAATGN